MYVSAGVICRLKQVCKRSCEGTSAPERRGTDPSQAAVGTCSAAAWVPVRLLGEQRMIHLAETSMIE